MTLKCRRIAALLVSCALLLVFLMTAEVQAKAGERIYAKALKVNITEISVVRYGNDGLEALIHGRRACSGGVPANGSTVLSLRLILKEDIRPVFRQKNTCRKIRSGFIGAMMCWYDHNMCPGVDSTDEYLFKQEIVWNVLNMEKKWRPDCRYEHSLGEKCGSGHTLESHREELFSDGLKWAEENADQVETEATVYEGDGQMLMDLTYKWNPEGKLRLQKYLRIRRSRTGTNVTAWQEPNTGFTKMKRVRTWSVHSRQMPKAGQKRQRLTREEYFCKGIYGSGRLCA